MADDDGLKRFIEDVSGDDLLAVEEDLGDGFVRLRTAEAERRQAKHDIRSVEDIVIEMLRNARDAHAGHVYVAAARNGDTRTLVFLDDGDGIPGHLQESVFEPRVTSKLDSMVLDRWGVHGRGMALYSIKSNTRTARIASSGPDLGSSFEIVADLSELSERKDQSTLPKLERDDDGKTVLGAGPHNIARTAAEFALESHDRPVVYLGSPSEIVARLAADGRRLLTDDQLLFCDDLGALPVCTRPAAAGDAAELMEACDSIGLSISERTAHRIMAGQIEPCANLLSKISPDKRPPARKPADLYHDERGLKMSKEDLGRFARALESAFRSVSGSYFIDLSEPPRIRVGKDSINVKFCIEKEL